jgi:hypothetical protein
MSQSAGRQSNGVGGKLAIGITGRAEVPMCSSHLMDAWSINLHLQVQ